MTRRRTWWILGTLAALAVVLIGALWFFLIDEAPPKVDDLLGYRTELPEAENGLVRLGLEKADVFWPGRDDPEVDPGEDLESIDEASVEGLSDAFDAEAAARVVERNEGILGRLEEALELRFQLPESDFLDVDPTVDPLIELRHAASVVGCRARLRLERGEREAALADILLLLRLGERLEGAQGGILPYLVGIAMQERALEHIARFLTDETNRQTLAGISRRLQTVDAEAESLADAFRAECAASLRLVDALEKGEVGGKAWGITDRLIFLPNQTKRILTEICRLHLRNIERPPAERETVDIAEEYGLTGWGALQNPMGKTIVATTAIGGEPLLTKRDRFLAVLGATRALVALRAYQLEHDRLPERLEELIPDYLEEMPRDPFDGRPLRYSPERRILHSVGANLEESGGSSEDDPSDARRDKNEPTFRIPF